jgi:hypothetical protein
MMRLLRNGETTSWRVAAGATGEAIRESAGTRSREQAERNARKEEAEADPTRVDHAQPCRATVRYAIRMFLEDEEARGLEHSSRKESRTLFERQFLPFCEAHPFASPAFPQEIPQWPFVDKRPIPSSTLAAARRSRTERTMPHRVLFAAGVFLFCGLLHRGPVFSVLLGDNSGHLLRATPECILKYRFDV